MLPRLDYPAFLQAANSVDEGDGLPPQLSSGWENDEEFLKRVRTFEFLKIRSQN